MSTSTEFKRELLAKVQALGGPAYLRRRRTPASPPAGLVKPQVTLAKPTQSGLGAPANPGDFVKRKYSTVRPRVLVIGSSTGGPPAVIKVLEELKPVLKYIPILITQHMPQTFTGIFANHIARATGVEAHEGQHNEVIHAGQIYVAPGGRHMIIDRQEAKPVIRLTDGPEINFCKPAVDPLFESVARIYGSASLAVVFTGMGADGAMGAVKIADAGGSVIAQDEASSVVWGMPGATAKAGACSAVLPLDKISKEITKLVQGITI